MTRNILILLFIIMYFLNGYIATYLVPDFNVEYDKYVEMIQLKDKLYEIMFLIVLAIPLFKKTRLSKALTVGTLLLVGASLIDKSVHHTYSYHVHDIVVIVGSLFAILIVYKYETASR